MVMSEQGGLAMHQLPMHHRGLVQPSLVMNPHPLNDSCALDAQSSKYSFQFKFAPVGIYRQLYFAIKRKTKNAAPSSVGIKQTISISDMNFI